MKPLREYQERMVQHIRDNDKCALFASMGTGKTLVVLEAIKHLPKPVLIVGPKRVVSTVWESEAKKFGYEYTFSRMMGSTAYRVQQGSRDTDIHLINIDVLVWLRQAYDKKWKWPTVIIDESSLVKSVGAKRTRAATWISKRVSNMVLLTGTPAPGGLLDIFSQVRLLDGGQRLGRTMQGYKTKYFYPTDFQQYNWDIRPGADKIINDKISDICVSLNAEDYLTLPDKIVNDIQVDLGSAMSVYREMVKEMFIEVRDSEIDAESAAVLVGKLSQLSAGAIYVDGGYEIIHSAKLDALNDVIEEAAGESVLIMYNFKHSLERIRNKYPDAVIADDEGIAAWNSGEATKLLLHPSAGYGLNIQGAGHIMVWFDNTWGLEGWQQSCARLHRSGQTHNVFIHRLIATGTIDEDIALRLEGKAQVQDLLLDHLKLVQ